MLVINPTPGVIKKDTKLPCYRYFLEKGCPEYKAGKCKFDHSMESMRNLFVKVKSNWSNLSINAPNKFHNLEDVLSEVPESEYDYNSLYFNIVA